MTASLLPGRRRAVSQEEHEALVLMTLDSLDSQHQSPDSPGEQLPPDSPQDPGEDSEVSWTDYSAGSEFIADPGPGFDTEQAPPAPTPEQPPEVLLDEWDEQRIREALVLQGEVTHALLRVGPEDTETWLHTERDLRAIAPPLTRILNRYDITRAAAAAGDEALLAAGLVRYGARNFTRRRKLQAARQEQGPQPVTGREAPPDTGPEHDEDWQRTMAPPALVPKGARR
jgi:hypothetical protein